MTKRVYLAGPDVFLPNASARGERLRRICTAHGLQGVFPLDALPDEPPAWSFLPPAQAIALRNEAHILRSDALVANLTPFRGPGADNGTAYELGFARALGRPVFAWSNAVDPYRVRCLTWPGATQHGDTWRDPDGLEIESFGLADNLMLACATAPGDILLGSPGVDRWSHLGAFETCVALAMKALR